MVSANIEEETDKSKEGVLGMQGGANGPVPSLEVHIQRDDKLTVKRKMKSWRRGASMEKCKYSLASIKVTSEWADCMIGDSRKSRPNNYAFQVIRSYKEISPACPYKSKYTHCIHWEWQLEARMHT